MKLSSSSSSRQGLLLAVFDGRGLYSIPGVSSHEEGNLYGDALEIDFNFLLILKHLDELIVVLQLLSLRWPLGQGARSLKWCFSAGTQLWFSRPCSRESRPGWAGQLSRRMAFSSCRRCFLSKGMKSFTNHSAKIVAIIHAFPEWRYVMGSCFMLIWGKHLGLP